MTEITYNELFNRSLKIITEFIRKFVGKELEVVRVTRVGYSLAITLSNSNTKIIEEALNYTSITQKRDGGWADTEETAWAAGFIAQIRGNDDPAVFHAIQWLKSVRLIGGGWGRHSRGRARIPTTALVLTLLPEAGCDEDYEWISREWAKDLAGPVQLSYKGGFYLLAAPKSANQDGSELIDSTIEHLVKDQNDDGGFAPWKNHPIGSDPWSTGVVLWGLAKWIDRVDPDVIERALHWLQVTQLPSGYWPYHYLDEGTSYALIGAVSAMRAIASRR